MNQPFWLLWKGYHTGVIGTKDIKHIVLLVRYIHLTRQRVVVHRAKYSPFEQLTHISCLETHRVDTPLTCRDVYRFSWGYREVLRTIRQRYTSKCLTRPIIENRQPICTGNPKLVRCATTKARSGSQSHC